MCIGRDEVLWEVSQDSRIVRSSLYSFSCAVNDALKNRILLKEILVELRPFRFVARRVGRARCAMRIEGKVIEEVISCEAVLKERKSRRGELTTMR